MQLQLASGIIASVQLHMGLHVTSENVGALQVKRLIKGGGVYLNNAKVSEQDKVVQAEDLIDGKLLLLAAGKKNKMLVRLSS